MSRILLIEDNPANRKLARDVLTGAGHEVLEAHEAETGIRMAQDETPDLILMDIQLPGTDGLTATRRLGRLEGTRDIPVVALTAHALRGDEERILAAGCVRYVAKPIRYKEFLQTVRQVLEEGR